MYNTRAGHTWCSFRQRKSFETLLKAEIAKTIKYVEISQNNFLKKIKLNHMKLLKLDSFKL